MTMNFRPKPTWERETSARTNVVQVDPLSVIYNEGQWKVSKVSPMRNLCYDAVKLKQYAAKICQTIVASVAVNSSVKYTVNLDVEANLRYSEDDACGLSITVYSKQEGTTTLNTKQKNNKTKIAYFAVLLSWGIKSALNDATHLPYMLERGEQLVGDSVKTTLQKIFDCNIKQFTFSQHQLLQFGFNFLENDTSKDVDAFRLEYKLPQSDLMDKLCQDFHIGDMRIIWNGAKDEATESTEPINVAYQLIQNQIFHMITVNVAAFHLVAVVLPKAEVKSRGLVKMKTPEHVHGFFTVLNEICASRYPAESMDVSLERE